MADRRAFLAGLAALPLVGGGVKLIGAPTAAAVPVTPELLNGYKAWLCFEHWHLCREMVPDDPRRAEDVHRTFYSDHPAWGWHLDGSPGRRQPSARAAVVLSAVGCPLADVGEPFFR